MCETRPKQASAVLREENVVSARGSRHFTGIAIPQHRESTTLNSSRTDSVAAGMIHGTTFIVLFGIAFCHLLNDMMQSLLSAIYPQLKANLDLNFAQVGMISMTYQLTASLLQPLVGLYSDRHPM